MTIRATGILIAILTLLLTGCGGEPAGGGTAADSDSASGAMSRTTSAPGAAVFIIEPVNGSTVSSPVTIKFGISGMDVIPAGQFTDNSGHHHLLIDTTFVNSAQPIASDDGHRHFGKGQTETTIDLESGQHTLQLVLGDGNHVPHEPPVISDIITITVQ